MHLEVESHQKIQTELKVPKFLFLHIELKNTQKFNFHVLKFAKIEISFLQCGHFLIAVLFMELLIVGIVDWKFPWSRSDHASQT